MIIKLRAWHEESKAMFYSDEGSWVFCISKDEPYIICADSRVDLYYTGLILMPWTGYKDMNNKDIYEEDIMLNGGIIQNHDGCYKDENGELLSSIYSADKVMGNFYQGTKI